MDGPARRHRARTTDWRPLRSLRAGQLPRLPPGALFGERWIHLGRDTLVGPHVSISAGMVPGQSMVTDPVVRIGDRCMIGRGSHIVGHFQVEIGDDVHTGPYVYITDQNHGYEDPDQVVHAQWPNDVPVLIGNGSWLGTGVVILPGTDLGKNVVVGAGAVVRGTFPDHCVIAGVPARVVRRYVPGSGWVHGTRLKHRRPRPLPRRTAATVGPPVPPRCGRRIRASGRSDRSGSRRSPPMPSPTVECRRDPSEPVAAHHLGRLLPALGDERLGGGEVVEVPGPVPRSRCTR